MSLNSKQPEGVEWFLDYQLGGRIVAEALRTNGFTVHIHTDLFPQDAQIIIGAYPAMMEYIDQHPAPFIVRVYRDGSLKPVDLEKVETGKRLRKNRTER